MCGTSQNEMLFEMKKKTNQIMFFLQYIGECGNIFNFTFKKKKERIVINLNCIYKLSSE